MSRQWWVRNLVESCVVSAVCALMDKYVLRWAPSFWFIFVITLGCMIVARVFIFGVKRAM